MNIDWLSLSTQLVFRFQ